MSFAQEIKKELLNQEFSHQQAQAFITGLITASGQRDGSAFVVKFNRPEIAENVKTMLAQMTITYYVSQEHKNHIIFPNFSEITKINLPGFFFAGVFLGGGSISDPLSPSYHLEIRFFLHQKARQVQSFLNQYAFNFTLIQRRSNHILYLKKAEQISDFLKAIQAFKALMTFEDARINRDFKNQLNRYSNLDTYNQNKLAKASVNFQYQYDFIKKHKLTSNFRLEELNFFEVKLKNPYSSLAELTKIYQRKTKIKKTRSGLSHYLIKLRKVYNRYH